MRKKIVWGIVTLWGLINLFVHSALATNPLVDKDPESLFQELTINERIGQLIDLRVHPTFDNLEALLATIREFHIGSITITGGDPGAVDTLISKIQVGFSVPVFVSVEQRQLSALPFGKQSVIPLFSTLQNAGDYNLAEQAITRIAELLSEAHVNGVSYNPASIKVMDNRVAFETTTSSETDSLSERYTPLLSQRQLAVSIPLRFQYSSAFGFTPRVLNYDAYQVSTTDRKKLNLVNTPRTILQIVDFPLFSENEALLFHKKVMTPLLWKEWQFSGVISADLEKITASRFSQPKMSDVRCLLKSGVDKIIVNHDPGLVQTAILDGLNSRFFRQNEIADKVKRILSLKSEVSWKKTNTGEYTPAPDFLNEASLREIAYRIYISAAQVQEYANPVIPVQSLRDNHFASLTIGPSNLNVFQNTLGKYAPFVHYNIPGLSMDAGRLENLRTRLAIYDYVIVGLFPNGLLSFDQTILQFLHDLNNSTKVVLLFFGDEKSTISEFDEFNHRIIMHEDCEFTQQIAPMFLFGANGLPQSLQRLGYSTPEMQGIDGAVLAKIDAIAKEAIEMGATPGMQILVARHGAVVLEKAFGYTTYDSLTAVDNNTIYDLASVTKVLATTPAIMHLYEKGVIALDSAIALYLPALDSTNKNKLEIRDILAHQSGLRSSYPFWRFTARNEDLWNYYYRPYPNELEDNTVAPGMYATPMVEDSLWRWTIDTKLRTRRNSREPFGYRYSDIGFYLLHKAVEWQTSTPMDVYLDSLIYQPMGMATLSYNPLCRFPQQKIAPTENDTEFRKMLVWGSVHDQIAAMTGGVGGHAGLFSTAHDAAKFMQMMLQGGTYGGQTYFSQATVDLFTSTAGKLSRRGLGWDKPEKGRGEHPASRYASFNSFGHTGFTGTIVWADPTFDLVFVLLSNRVHPDMENNKLTSFNIRKRIQDLVYEAIWSFEKQLE